MDEKPAGAAPPEKTEAEEIQEHLQHLRTQRRSSRWLRLAVLVALAAAIAWGFMLGMGYSRHESPRVARAPAPGPTESTPAPGRSLAEPVEVQSALDAYKPSLKIYDVTAGYEEDLLEGDVPVVHGKIQNNGDRTLKFVEVTAYFLDADGRRIHETKFPVVGAPLNLMGDAPLRPGYISNFAFKASDTPSEWSVGVVECEVTAIRFGP